LGSLEHLAALAQRQGTSLNISLPTEDYLVDLDADRTQRALQNLVTNALKFSQPGGTVEVQAEVIQDKLFIRVRDWGLGIPAKELPHIFEAFYRVNRPQHRQIEGTGLGLAIVKTIIEQQQGWVTVDSQEGEGSLFTIVLPLAE
jgi:signal transduction histidine kinase